MFFVCFYSQHDHNGATWCFCYRINVKIRFASAHVNLLKGLQRSSSVNAVAMIPNPKKRTEYIGRCYFSCFLKCVARFLWAVDIQPTSFHIISWFKSSCEEVPVYRVFVLSALSPSVGYQAQSEAWLLSVGFRGGGLFPASGYGPIHLSSSVSRGGCGHWPAGPR